MVRSQSVRPLDPFDRAATGVKVLGAGERRNRCDRRPCRLARKGSPGSLAARIRTPARLITVHCEHEQEAAAKYLHRRVFPPVRRGASPHPAMPGRHSLHSATAHPPDNRSARGVQACAALGEHAPRPTSRSIVPSLGVDRDLDHHSRPARSGPPSAASGPTWPIQKPRVPPEKRPSVISATFSPMPLPVQRSGSGEHLAHARATLRALVADHDNRALRRHLARLDRG